MSDERVENDAFLGVVGADGRVRDALDPNATRAPLGSAPDEGTWGAFSLRDGRAALIGSPLARPGTARAAIYAVAARHGVSPLHPAAVRTEAAAVAAAPGVDDPALSDLTHLPFVTIDEEHSKDLDQAVFVERAADGQRIWYAIADPSWSVRPGTALFEDALRRGSTFYLPGLVAPMLPATLSEGVISLNPGVDRRAMVFEVRLGGDGEVKSTRVHRARVRSRVKTSYDAVQAYFDGAAPVPGGEAQVAASLDALAAVGRSRLARAEGRDIVQVRRREISLSLDGDDGMRFVAWADPRNDVERFNEQISLLCNIEGARLLQREDGDDDGVEPIYRVHASPREDRLRAFARQTSALAHAHRLDEAVWRWRRRRSLADYLAGLPRDGRHARLARAIHRQALLTGGRSGFATAPAPHHGVGAEVYARFTAPMREIVGIFTHKETWETLGRTGGHGPLAAARPAVDDELLRAQVAAAANRARQTQRTLEREANRLVHDQLFGDDLRLDHGRRPVRRGTVMGMARGKVHVQLDRPPIDVKVYLPHLAAQRGMPLRIDRAGVAVRERDGGTVARTGDEVGIRVLGRDPSRDRWTLELVG